MHFGRGQQLCLLKAKQATSRDLTLQQPSSVDSIITLTLFNNMFRDLQPKKSDTRQGLLACEQLTDQLGYTDDSCWLHANINAKPQLAC